MLVWAVGGANVNIMHIVTYYLSLMSLMSHPAICIKASYKMKQAIQDKENADSF